MLKTFVASLGVQLNILCLLLSKAFTDDREPYLKPVVLNLLQSQFFQLLWIFKWVLEVMAHCNIFINEDFHKLGVAYKKEERTKGYWFGTNLIYDYDA